MNLPITGVKRKPAGAEGSQLDAFLDNINEEGEIIINAGDMVDFVYGAAAFISDVNGDINPDSAFLSNYKKQTDVFKPMIKKKEPNQFQISAGAAFKLRQC